MDHQLPEPVREVVDNPRRVFVQLTVEHHRRALELQDAVIAKLASQVNYTGITVPDRFYVGYMGEFAVSEWFTQYGIEHEHKIVADGRSQKHEIIVNGLRFPITVEVKTHAHPGAWKLLVSEHQLYAGRLDSLWLIAVRSWERRAKYLMSIEGGMLCKHVERMAREIMPGQVAWSRTVPFAHLPLGPAEILDCLALEAIGHTVI